MEETHFTTQDRATLTELSKSSAVLESKLDRAIKDIANMSTNFAKQTEVSDHEARIRTLEKESEDHALVKKVVYGAVSFILLAVLSSIVYLVIKN